MTLASINVRRRGQGVSDRVWEDVTATYLLIENVCGDHLQSYSTFPRVGNGNGIIGQRACEQEEGVGGAIDGEKGEVNACTSATIFRRNGAASRGSEPATEDVIRSWSSEEADGKPSNRNCKCIPPMPSVLAFLISSTK